jgi:hypothetical protein
VPDNANLPDDAYGSDGGVRHWAIIASLVATAELNGVELEG